MTDYERAYSDLRAGVEALADEWTAQSRAVLVRMGHPDAELQPHHHANRIRALLASSAPATASEGATEPGICLWANQICEQPNHHGCLTCTTTADRGAAGVTSSDGDRGLSEEWSEERRTEHFYRQCGRTFSGYGPSMDPHRCGDPDEECWTVTEVRRVTPWRRVETEARR